MQQLTDNEALAKRYLLGMLSPEEGEHFEQRYFADDSLFEEMETVEDQLIDAYVRGQLNASEREQFENALKISKRLAERVRFGRILAKHVSVREAPQPVPEPIPATWRTFFASFFTTPQRLAVPAMVLLIVVGAPLLTIAWLRSRAELKQLNAERAQLEQTQRTLTDRVKQLEAEQKGLTNEAQTAKSERDRVNQELKNTEDELADVRRQLGTSAIITATLFPGGSRSTGSAPDVTIPTKPSTVRLNLVLDYDKYPRYAVSIESADRRVAVAQKELKAKGSSSQRSITPQFPSTRLRAGDYAVTVSGLTPSGTYTPVFNYSLRVSKH